MPKMRVVWASAMQGKADKSSSKTREIQQEMDELRCTKHVFTISRHLTSPSASWAAVHRT
eukprot:5317988-Amphidinium_carterae.3